MLSTQVPQLMPGIGARVRFNAMDTSADAPNQVLADLDDLLNWNHWGDHLGALRLCLRFPQWQCKPLTTCSLLRLHIPSLGRWQRLAFA
jgi:hypothetical protein